MEGVSIVLLRWQNAVKGHSTWPGKQETVSNKGPYVAEQMLR